MSENHETAATQETHEAQPQQQPGTPVDAHAHALAEATNEQPLPPLPPQVSAVPASAQPWFSFSSLSASLPASSVWLDSVRKQVCCCFCLFAPLIAFQGEAIVDVYKRFDLQEFVTVVGNESAQTVKNISLTINNPPAADKPAVASPPLEPSKIPTSPTPLFAAPDYNSLKTSADTLFSTFNKNLTTFLSSAIEISPAQTTASGLSIGAKKQLAQKSFDRKSTVLAKIRRDPKTYIVDPIEILKIPPGPYEDMSEGSPRMKEKREAEEYLEWIANWRLDDKWKEIEFWESEDEELRIIKSRLVPSHMTEEMFWTRYYFRAFQVDREEESRRKLLANVETTVSAQKLLKEETFDWGSESDEDDSKDTVQTEKNNEEVVEKNDTDKHTDGVLRKSVERESETDVETDAGFDVVSVSSASVETANKRKPTSSSENEDDWADWE
ncbi:BSD domain-containing protein 1 [Nowakowskiella sp. JEL0078]|nr:BSD domain-containing protein 1 [Nowakowskiella sp. JEL0078]